MPDDIDATIPPNTKEMLDQTSKEGVERSRRISSLSSKIVEMEKQAKLDANKMSNEISKISKKQRQVREQMKGIESSTIPEIEEMAPHVNKILTGISGAVGSLATGMRRITLDTANSAKNVVGQYGRAISEDISVNRENLMAMSLAKATPLFGYFAAKFMQTDVFKSAAAKIKQSLGSAISSVGSGLKNIASSSASRVKNIFAKNIDKAPKMQEGGYVERGGVAQVHPAEVIAPIDKVLTQFQGKEKVQEQTLETLKDLSSNMKMYGNYFQKEKMNRKGLIRDFVGGLWRGKYGRSWEFRMLIATEKLQEAITKTPTRFKLAWETIMWKHPMFRRLVGLTRGLWSTSKMFGKVFALPFKLFGMTGPYLKDVKEAMSAKSPLAQIGLLLAKIHTTMMPKLDAIRKSTGTLANIVTGESGYEKEEGTWRRITGIFRKLGISKKPELSMGIGKGSMFGAAPQDQHQLMMPYRIKLIEENTRKLDKTVKLLPAPQKELLLEQKKTRRSVGRVGRGITTLKTKLKGGLSFLWKLLLMGWNLVSGIAANITKYLPLIAVGLGKAGLAAGAGVAGYAFGSWINKKIDEAFGERGGMGKWIYDQTHKYGNKWYQVAWGFVNLPLEVSTSLQNKTKETVKERIKNAYEKWTPKWIKDGVSLVTYPWRKAGELREKTEASLREKAKNAYDKFAPESVKKILGFVTSPFKDLNKWLTDDKKTIHDKVKNAVELEKPYFHEKILSLVKSPFESFKTWLSGDKKKIEENIKNFKEKESAGVVSKVSSFLTWPFKKLVELKDSYKKKISEKFDISIKDIDTKIDKIVDMITWPIRKMVELVEQAKNWTMAKLEKVPVIGSLLKWIGSKEEKEVKAKSKVPTPVRVTTPKKLSALDKEQAEKQRKESIMRVLGASNLAYRNGELVMIKMGGKWRQPSESELSKITGMARGGITTSSVLARLHPSEAVVPLPPKLTEAITGRLIDKSDIAKRDVSNIMAEGRYAAGEFGKRTGDIASQMKQGQAQINNAIVYTSNLMANTSSNMASTIADSMGSRGGFSSGDDFASQVLKCNLS